MSRETQDHFEPKVSYKEEVAYRVGWNARSKQIDNEKELLLEALKSALPYLIKETRIQAEEAIKKATE